MKKILVLAVMLLGLNAVHAQTKTPEQTETIAKTDFPPCVIKDLQGQDVDLKKFTHQGKVTIISFWATWCSPCKKELENMTDLLDDWGKKYNVQLVAISIDDTRNLMKVKPYVDGKKWKFTVLSDVNSETRRVLNYPSVPYTLVIDKDGKIVYKHIGYQEGDEFVLEDQLKKLVK